MKHKKKIWILTFIMILSGILQSTQSLAATLPKGSISIVCPVEGMELSLYRVADYDEAGSFTLTGSFAKYAVSLKQEDQEGWQGAAHTLSDCAGRDNIRADATGKAGSDGMVCFTDLTRGLYLVCGRQTESRDGGKTVVYMPQVALIALPDAALGTDPYQVTGVLKYEKRELQTETKRKLHVLKVWKQDTEKSRPASIEVELLRTDANGNTTVADRQVLKKDNQWSYTWENLSAQAQWSVTEKEVPAGYTESTRREGNTVILTNTATGAVQGPDAVTAQKLPQTGQLWWPVPLLLAAGAGCLLTGRKLCHSKENQEK